MPLSNTTANKGHNSDTGRNQTHASPMIPAHLLTATDLARIREMASVFYLLFDRVN